MTRRVREPFYPAELLPTAFPVGPRGVPVFWHHVVHDRHALS